MRLSDKWHQVVIVDGKPRHFDVSHVHLTSSGTHGRIPGGIKVWLVSGNIWSPERNDDLQSAALRCL